jgi:hypothetical protein
MFARELVRAMPSQISSVHDCTTSYLLELSFWRNLIKFCKAQEMPMRALMVPLSLLICPLLPLIALAATLTPTLIPTLAIPQPHLDISAADREGWRQRDDHRHGGQHRSALLHAHADFRRVRHHHLCRRPAQRIR